jgi:hypothetical protein
VKGSDERPDFGDQLLAFLTELAETLEASESFDERFTVRTVQLNRARDVDPNRPVGNDKPGDDCVHPAAVRQAAPEEVD